MPMHVRRQIRDAVKLRLTGLPATAERVLTGRSRPLSPAHAHTLLIYTPTETSSRAAKGPEGQPILDRPLDLFIEGRVSAGEVPDDLLDQIAAEVEAAMWSDPSFGGLALNLQLVGTDVVTEMPEQGESHIGGIRLHYRFTYRTYEGAPTAHVP